MKTIAALLSAIIFCSFSLPEPAEYKLVPTIPPKDRAFLLNYFEKTGDELVRSVKRLSAEQMQFKPGEETWSVAECLEHIIRIDEALFNMAVTVIEQPANPERRNEIKNTDEDIIAGMTDRYAMQRYGEIFGNVPADLSNV